MHPSLRLPLLGLATLSTLLAGCGRRPDPPPPGTAPVSAAAGVTATVTGIQPMAHGIGLTLAIANRSGGMVAIPRRQYQDMTGIVLTDGTVQVVARRHHPRRVAAPGRWTVEDGGHAELDLVFTDPALDTARPLELRIRAMRGDQPLPMTLAIPAPGGVPGAPIAR